MLLAMHDCAPEARLREGRWEVLIFPHNADDARMFPVPAHAVLPRENLDGGLSFAGHRMDLSIASCRHLTLEAAGTGNAVENARLETQ